ncbi:MAG: arsenate reductase ArsC [Candidatus Omnitrophica bacterium]|nr:arsenate reductase ArsC [Candidatus Omnitrophota bacterium]MBI2174469.1 arsenate reductase ArsC [Candidatus Omnitrophota bacterium]
MVSSASNPKRSILFVCVGNSFRSQMAEAFAKVLGKKQWEVWSAGSHPSGFVHPLAIQLMEEAGMSLSGHHSKGLSDLPWHRWDYVVTMGCGDTCPSVEAKHRAEWNIPDPTRLSIEQARHIRDQLQQSVRDLIQPEGIAQ